MWGYGFLNDIDNTPTDNRWTDSRDITLNDDSVVFGYEGATVIDDEEGGFFSTAELFIEWRTANTPQEEIL